MASEVEPSPVWGLERMNPLKNLTPGQAGRVAGASFIISFVLVVYVGDFVLPNFLIPGDTDQLAKDIEDDARLFDIAVIGYLMVLALDAAVAFGLMVALGPADRTLANLTGVLRLVYVAIMVVSVLALAFETINTSSYGTVKLIGYLFFTGHILVTGYIVFFSGYIPRIFGVFLFLAFVSYILAFYLSPFVPEAILMIFMLFMIIAELSLSAWLVWKGTELDDLIEEHKGSPTAS
jgi:hypothetical protein